VGGIGLEIHYLLLFQAVGITEGKVRERRREMGRKRDSGSYRAAVFLFSSAHNRLANSTVWSDVILQEELWPKKE